MELTQEQRIAIIRHAAESSNKVIKTKSVEDFIADIKSEEFFAEHGLVEAKLDDLNEEIGLITHSPIAESIHEEEEEMGVSEEMRNVYHV